MGICGSKQVEVGLCCPEGYNKEKFKVLLKLYDKIDKDGDQAVDIREISEISNLHIENRLLLLDIEKENAKKKYDYKILCIDDTKNRLKKLTQIEKNRMFCRAVTGSENPEKIGWDDFFNYMKDRTDDIPNIVF
tara:strand:+ start:330 stop:731 length:402 start_codon:yes stop_codon:yes gene_type:complete